MWRRCSNRLASALGLALLVTGCGKGADPGGNNAAGQGGGSARDTPALAAVDRTPLPPPVDLDGVWQPVGNVSFPPVAETGFTAAGAKAFAANKEALVKGGDPMARCLPPGPARLMMIAQPIAFSWNEDMLMLQYQVQRLVRFVNLTARYAVNSDPSFLGEAHGRWEKTALVIETKNFKPDGWLDARGLPHGAKLTLSERIEKTGPDTLVDHITVNDPDIYVAPIKATVSLKRIANAALGEDVCVERIGMHI